MTWEKDGKFLLPGNPKHINILANNSLRIEGVSSKDAGQYQCSASNAIGVHVVRAELRVRGEKTTVKSVVSQKLGKNQSAPNHQSNLRPSGYVFGY